jgi:uncharacterized membrane protein YtjA (UPF0391 family)
MEVKTMAGPLLWLAVIFLLCAVVWGVLGFGGFIAIAATLLWWGIVILVILFVVALIASLFRR